MHYELIIGLAGRWDCRHVPHARGERRKSLLLADENWIQGDNSLIESITRRLLAPAQADVANIIVKALLTLTNTFSCSLDCSAALKTTAYCTKRTTAACNTKKPRQVQSRAWMFESRHMIYDIWYDYFNVHSKADRCQLNLPHSSKNYKKPSCRWGTARRGRVNLNLVSCWTIRLYV